MANSVAPSEFDGHRQPNTIPPPVTPNGRPGHENLSASEKLRLLYTTYQADPNDLDSTASPDLERSAFDGLLPYEEQLKIREDAGDMDVGV